MRLLPTKQQSRVDNRYSTRIRIQNKSNGESGIGTTKFLGDGHVLKLQTSRIILMPKKILIVDDEEDILTYLSALFQDNGYETVTAGDGESAFEKALAEKPDLITLDLAMPEQSGVKTYRSYKETPELKDTPVIVITGVGEDMETYFKKMKNFANPEGFINKPIDSEELLSQVNNLVAE